MIHIIYRIFRSRIYFHISDIMAERLRQEPPWLRLRHGHRVDPATIGMGPEKLIHPPPIDRHGWIVTLTRHPLARQGRGPLIQQIRPRSLPQNRLGRSDSELREADRPPARRGQRYETEPEQDREHSHNRKPGQGPIGAARRRFRRHLARPSAAQWSGNGRGRSAQAPDNITALAVETVAARQMRQNSIENAPHPSLTRQSSALRCRLYPQRIITAACNPPVWSEDIRAASRVNTDSCARIDNSDLPSGPSLSCSTCLNPRHRVSLKSRPGR